MKNKHKYILLVDQGTYMAPSFFKLVWEVFKHRCYHLYKDRKWMD